MTFSFLKILIFLVMPFIDENSLQVFPATHANWLPVIKSREYKEVILTGGNREPENLWVPFIPSHLLRSLYGVAGLSPAILFYYGR